MTERPWRLLVVIASPMHLADYCLDVIGSAERQGLHTALDGLGSEMAIIYLETGTATPATFDQIRLRLSEGYQVVPFLCHGAASAGGAVLYPEREDGTVESIQAEWLVSAEAQITPSVQRSKAMRQAMSTSTTHRAA